jgi:GcrA cell cycle regulator
MAWSKEETDLAVEMAKKNHTAAEISKALGTRSRNAVIGHLHRVCIRFGAPRNLDLEAVRKAHRKQMLERLANIAIKRANEPTLATGIGGVLPTLRMPDASQTALELRAGANGVAFIHRLSNQCPWILGEPRGADTRCCGQPLKQKSNWCATHHALAYYPKSTGKSPTRTREVNKHARTNVF